MAACLHVSRTASRLILLKTHVEDSPTEAPPGTVVDASRDAIHVATGHEGRIAIDACSSKAEGRSRFASSWPVIAIADRVRNSTDRAFAESK